MSKHRIYCAELTANKKTIVLSDQEATYILRVLRLKVNDPVELFNGHGFQFIAYIEQINKLEVKLVITDAKELSRESPLMITLVQGIAKGERMDWILQKTTELGVSHIIPVFSKRSVVKLNADEILSRMKHWRGIITHACAQCGRNTLPLLSFPENNLADALTQVQASQCFFLNPEGMITISELSDTRDEPITIVVGPEGGFSADETELMISLGIRGLKLGPRILRTETAGLAALSAIGAVRGDF